MSVTLTTNYSLSKWAKGHPDWHLTHNSNADTIDAELKKHQDEANAAKTNSDLVANGHEATGTYGSGLLAEATANVSNEVKDARGSADTVALRLAISINDDGTLKTTTTSGDQWPTASMTNPVYNDAGSFRVDGDARPILQPGTPLAVAFHSNGTRYLHVRQCTYAAGPDETTVYVWNDEAVINDTIDQVGWGFVRPNTCGAAGTPGATVRDYENCSFDVYYYDASSYDDPFDATGGRVATTNSGKLSGIVYASGLIVGVTYSDATDDAEITLIERKLNLTTIETWTPTYDVTTGLITDFDRS